MKLAAIYNVFDGEELLEGSIKQIDQSLDHIIIVWQETSNFGNKNKELKAHLDDLAFMNDKIELIKYEPDLDLGGTKNEIEKRYIGLKKAKELDCTHFLFMDCDEYYNSWEFIKAKEEIIEKHLEGTACYLYTYYKKPEWRLTPIEKYFVPFIHKIKANMEMGNVPYPVNCDPTRRIGSLVNNGNFKILEPNLITMHHYSFVRKDIARKLLNSSASINWRDKINAMLTEFNNVSVGDKLGFFYTGHKLEQTDNHFNIDIHGCY